MELKGALVYAQSGGPTAVINSSLLGVIKEAALNPQNITGVFGALNGIKGILEENLYDLKEESTTEIELLKTTPSAILGSVRHKLADPDVNDADFQQILKVFQKYNIRYFFYNGGNDSMDTCEKVHRFLSRMNYECRVIGIPKTIDNDLAGTDYCPGFGSAAKFIATTCLEIKRDVSSYPHPSVTIIEIMGRNAGWLTASAMLANLNQEEPCVNLVYLPEVSFNTEKFVSDISELYTKEKKVIAAVSEGIQFEPGHYVADNIKTCEANSQDGFKHKTLGGVGAYLADIIREKISGAKVRNIELSLLQRCAAHISSVTDSNCAEQAGAFAVQSALKGETGKMVSFKRTKKQEFENNLELSSVADSANYERLIPKDWITLEGNGVTQEFINYALPYVQGENLPAFEKGLPRYAKLRFIKAK